MQWLRTKHPARTLNCSYCGASGAFPNTLSFEYLDKEFLLFSCPECYSLIYDPQEPSPTVMPPYDEAHMESVRRENRHYLQVGCSVDFITLGALCAMAPVPREAWHKHVFVDVGAGLGLASHIMQRCFGLDVMAIESSYAGELGEHVLGVNIRPGSLEPPPEELIAALQERPCVLHINSVIADLRDPVAALRELRGRASVAAITMIAPDASTIDRLTNFSTCLPFLAPGKHLHLPSAEGLRRLLRSLGFDHTEIRETNGWLVAVGSATPLSLPTPAEVERAQDMYLEQLIDHSNEDASGGAAARLLSGAIVGEKSALLSKLREHFARTLDRPALMAALKGGSSWEEIPLYLPAAAFWLAVDAFRRDELAVGFEWLDLVEVAIERLEQEDPVFASSVMDYKWEGQLYRAIYLARQGHFDVAERVLQAFVDAEADLEGPPPEKLQRAREVLNTIRETQEAAARKAIQPDAEPPTHAPPESAPPLEADAEVHTELESARTDEDPEGARTNEPEYSLDGASEPSELAEETNEKVQEPPAFALDGGRVVSEDDFAQFRIDPLSIRPERRKPAPARPSLNPKPEPFKRKTTTTRWRSWLSGDDKQKKG